MKLAGVDTVKDIESRVQQYLGESFAGIGVEIEMPPPDLRTFFGNAQIFLNDGFRGAVETKGDGLRRATIFSIFRTFAKLSLARATQGEETSQLRDCHVLLFEESELYLHPLAQRVLVLERGALEAYYPDEVTRSQDKPEMSHEFCQKAKSRDDVLDRSEDVSDGAGNPLGRELEVICREIFFTETAVKEEPAVVAD